MGGSRRVRGGGSGDLARQAFSAGFGENYVEAGVGWRMLIR